MVVKVKEDFAKNRQVKYKKYYILQGERNMRFFVQEFNQNQENDK